MMAELESAAKQLGYRRIHLTIGPRQPDARELFLATGYTPWFDLTDDPETIGSLRFSKELIPETKQALSRSPSQNRALPHQEDRLVPRQLATSLGPDARRQLHSRSVNSAPRRAD